MANLNITGMDEMIAKIGMMGSSVDAACCEAVHAGAEVALECMRAEIPVSNVHTEHLRDHIKIVREGHDPIDGYYCDIYPDGVRPGGGKAGGRRYATIGFVLEYGHSGVPPKPWMRTGIEKGRQRISAAMQGVLMEKLGGKG